MRICRDLFLQKGLTNHIPRDTIKSTKKKNAVLTPGVTAARSIADGAVRTQRRGCRFVGVRRGQNVPSALIFLEVSIISKKALINEEIKAKEVRVVNATGEQIGVLSIEKALRMAFEAGLDLVEIAPEGKPPVCKIMDFGDTALNARSGRKKSAKTSRQPS